MRKRIQIYLLVGLLVVLAYVLATSHGAGPGTNGVLASDANFVPLNVDEPELRLDLLAQLKKLEYTGIHRDIFSAVALPTPPPPGSVNEKPRHPYPTVPKPPPPKPVEVPGTLYGYAQMKDSGKRVAFFQEGEDVLVVQEGAEFLHGYRLIKINDNSADVEEMSSGRHANVPMTQPLNSADAGVGGNNP